MRLRELLVLRLGLIAFALALAGCSVPYPLLRSGGPFEQPAGGSTDPLDARGARVQVVAVAPPRCRFLGLATGVGSVANLSERTSNARFPEFQARAMAAICNAVGAAGGTHVVIDVEDTWYRPQGGESVVDAVVIRGAALACSE